MEALRVHAPWLKAALIKVPVTLGILLYVHWLLTGAWPALSWPPIVFPIVYLHLFKYWYHKHLMHEEAPRWLPAWLQSTWDGILKSHLRHHGVLMRKTYRTRDPMRLKEIISDWYVFPALLALHYVLALAAFGGQHALGFPAWSWSELAAAFVALSAWFALFEAVHWFAHVEGTWLDYALSRVWLVGWLWVYTVEYHREHHDHVETVLENGAKRNTFPYNFHFLPPWLLDWIFNTGISPRICRDSSGLYRVRPS